MRGRFAFADVKAGWIDAGRDIPRLRDARVGALDYRIGYIARWLVRRHG